MSITTHKLQIQDCVYICGDRHKDDRGYFQEVYSARHEMDFNREWKQTNVSWSWTGTLRGMHYAPYSKLVTCLQGNIFDAIVDLRPESPTFRKWVSINLSGSSNCQVFVPTGCAHGFYSQYNALVMYQQDDTYEPGKEESWHYNSFGILWPKPEWPYALSERDTNAPAYK